ncbi:hypothetical protein V8F33_012866 [Rhypophila sp. PSN 637]
MEAFYKSPAHPGFCVGLRVRTSGGQMWDRLAHYTYTDNPVSTEFCFIIRFSSPPRRMHRRHHFRSLHINFFVFTHLDIMHRHGYRQAAQNSHRAGQGQWAFIGANWGFWNHWVGQLCMVLARTHLGDVMDGVFIIRSESYISLDRLFVFFIALALLASAGEVLITDLIMITYSSFAWTHIWAFLVTFICMYNSKSMEISISSQHPYTGVNEDHYTSYVYIRSAKGVKKCLPALL